MGEFHLEKIYRNRKKTVTKTFDWVGGDTMYSQDRRWRAPTGATMCWSHPRRRLHRLPGFPLHAGE